MFDEKKIFAHPELKFDELGRVIIDDENLLQSIHGAIASSIEGSRALDSDCSCNSNCGSCS